MLGLLGLLGLLGIVGLAHFRVLSALVGACNYPAAEEGLAPSTGGCIEAVLLENYYIPAFAFFASRSVYVICWWAAAYRCCGDKRGAAFLLFLPFLVFSSLHNHWLLATPASLARAFLVRASSLRATRYIHKQNAEGEAERSAQSCCM